MVTGLMGEGFVFFVFVCSQKVKSDGKIFFDLSTLSAGNDGYCFDGSLNLAAAE